jgi:hypothetical protein
MTELLRGPGLMRWTQRCGALGDLTGNATSACHHRLIVPLCFVCTLPGLLLGL